MNTEDRYGLILRCPSCGTAFGKEETDCSRCGFRLIFDGSVWDARLARDPPAEYSRQWELWEEGRLGRKDRIYGIPLTDCFNRVMASLCLPANHLKNKRILEVGYGQGTILEGIQKECGAAFGIDLTYPPRSSRMRPGTCYCGDLHHSPFSPHQFDLVLCRGVLQHTPDPKFAFSCVADQVAPGGALYIEIYEKGDKGSLRLRNLFPGFPQYPERVQLFLAGCIGTMRAILEILRRRSSHKIGFRTRVGDFKLAVYDVLIPKYTSQHDPNEIYSWFHESGFSVNRHAPRQYLGTRNQ